MLRNYLMPGFALVLLAVFAAPRPTPSVAPESGRSAGAVPVPPLASPAQAAAELRTEQAATASGQ